MITTVDALHLSEGRLLVAFLGEANKAVSAGLSSDCICHDFGRFAGRVWIGGLVTGLVLPRIHQSRCSVELHPS